MNGEVGSSFKRIPVVHVRTFLLISALLFNVLAMHCSLRELAGLDSQKRSRTGLCLKLPDQCAFGGRICRFAKVNVNNVQHFFD